MSFGLRDNKRYGAFKANSDIGEIKIDISISGFGEQIIVTKDKEELYNIDTLEDEDQYDETDDYICLGRTKIYKPFIRCLKRYK